MLLPVGCGRCYCTLLPSLSVLMADVIAILAITSAINTVNEAIGKSLSTKSKIVLF